MRLRLFGPRRPAVSGEVGIILSGRVSPMLRMFRRVRRQRPSRVDGEVDDDDRRSSAQRVAPWGLPAKSRLQWWKGAISGAIAAVLLMRVFTLFAGHPVDSRTPMPPNDGPNQERCPVRRLFPFFFLGNFLCCTSSFGRKSPPYVATSTCVSSFTRDK